MRILIILLLVASCGKDRTREQIKENNTTLIEMRQDATDPVIINTITVAIDTNNKELAEYEAIEEATEEAKREIASVKGSEEHSRHHHRGHRHERR